MEHDVFKHVTCQIMSCISLSDAEVRHLSVPVYSTKPVCHAFADELRHAKIFQHLSYFKI